MKKISKKKILERSLQAHKLEIVTLFIFEAATILILLFLKNYDVEIVLKIVIYLELILLPICIILSFRSMEKIKVKLKENF